MAYAAVVSLAQTIDQILDHDQYFPISFPAANQEIISIHDFAIFLQVFLEYFREKATSFEERIRDVAYKAEDIIENYFMWERIAPQGGSTKSTVVGPSKIKFRPQLRKVAEKMMSLAQEVVEIKNVVLRQGRKFSNSPAAAAAASSISRLAPTVKNSDMIGLEGDRMQIIDRLLGKSRKLEIVPIVGMGGIGKTTLASYVYHDPWVVDHFETRAWVTASQDYSAQEILSSLLVDMGVQVVEISGQSFRDAFLCLRGTRYLIVMDNMWSTKTWDDVRMIFPDDKRGSRIMLTTRQLDVGAYADPCSRLHEMRLMDVDQSWNLLRRKVFVNETCPTELEDVGKQIARSCSGLPLSIIIVAELLSKINKTRASWETIAESVISALATKDGPFEKMLSLNYTALPHHLRTCLLYMGGFPADCEICVSELIKLWMAEGFLKPNVSGTFEGMAEEYLEDLVRRSLVLVTSRKYNGKIKSCNLHDSVRELCLRKVQEEKFLLPVTNYLPSTTLRRYFLPQILKNQRRVSLTSYDLHLKETICNSPVRTIICIPQRGHRSIGPVRDFRLLRVLHALNKNCDWNWEPDQVFELIHLRYLSANIPSIPTAISKLQNLQTLIIYRSEVRLPVEIWKLPRLRHLIAISFHPLPHPEEETSPLENLQTLSLATNFLCSEVILKLIPNLQKLGIRYPEDKFDQDYYLENLQYLQQLENLKLQIHGDFPSERNLNLNLPWVLKKLSLSGCRLHWKAMMIVGSLSNLEVLKLRDLVFPEGVWETTEGEFAQLKFLLIDNTDLQHWITQSRHFPSLRSLLLHHCRNLSEIPHAIGKIPTLELIEVDDWNGSLVVSALTIREQQRNYGNRARQVRVKHFWLGKSSAG